MREGGRVRNVVFEHELDSVDSYREQPFQPESPREEAVKVHSQFVLAASLVLALGCETAGKRTAIGAGVGAAAGAGVGALIGGWKGAAIGAGVGALAGGSVGLYLDKQAKEIEKAGEKVAETQRTEKGVVVQMRGDVLFDSGESTLREEAVEELGKVADVLAQYSDDRVRVEGHTDSLGKPDLNEALSVRRAHAVRYVLITRGVRESQLTAIGLGATRPIADNKTAAGRAKNRRVELHIDVPNAT